MKSFLLGWWLLAPARSSATLFCFAFPVVIRNGVAVLKEARCEILLVVCILMIFNANANKISFGPETTYEIRNSGVGEEPGMWCSHPADPNQLIGITSAPESAFRSGNFLRQNFIVRLSANGGRTWTETLRTSGAPLEVDPACAYGMDGQVFISAMANFGESYDGANLWRSSDGGRTWEAPTRIDHARFFDRPFLNVDLGDTPFRGRLYVVAWGKTLPGDALQRPDQMVVYTSDDGGKTFNPPAVVPTKNDEGKGAVHPGEAVVLPDGTYVISWTEVDMEIDYSKARMLPSPGMSTVKIARSVDGGRSFGPPIEVAKSKWRMESEGREIFVGKYYPTIAVDQTGGLFKNNIYIAWADASEARQQIMLSRSSDSGVTWEEPKVLSEGHAFNSEKPARGPHNKMVVLRVNKNGVVGAFYYAQSNPDPDVQFWPVFTASVDGGATWSSLERVLEAPVRYSELNLDWNCTRLMKRQGVMQPARCWFPGRTSVPNCLYGLVPDAAGDFHVFAFSNTGGRPKFTMRTARVNDEVARRVEVDAEVHIEMYTVSYDPESQVVTANAIISNVGSHELRLPIRLVVDGVGDTPLVEQKIEILNSDNERLTAGAWWDFWSSLGNRVLAVGEQSAPRLLKIRFNGRMKMSISSAQRMQLNLRVYKTKL